MKLHNQVQDTEMSGDSNAVSGAIEAGIFVEMLCHMCHISDLCVLCGGRYEFAKFLFEQNLDHKFYT